MTHPSPAYQPDAESERRDETDWFQVGYDEAAAQWDADHPGGVITPEERASLDAYEGTGL